MKEICVVTSAWPYVMDADFTAGYEVERLSEYYHVTVVSCCPEIVSVQTDQANALKNITVFQYSSFVSKWSMIPYCFTYLLSDVSKKEIKDILKGEERILERLAYSLHFYANAVRFFRYLESIFRDSKPHIIYTYWNDFRALGALLFKAKHPLTRVITRTHGADLYESRHPGGRQPFSFYKDKYLDGIIFACEAGKQYYIDTYRMDNNNIENEKCFLCRLGTIPRVALYHYKKGSALRIISVSSMIPLKRISLIISALELLTDISIEWIHFGAGQLFEELKCEAAQKLDHMNNVRYQFQGQTEHKDLISFYEHNEEDVFITTSQTEGGCPVSIQEAMMFGLPIIATSVGGIPEMFDTDELLLSPNPSPEELAIKIRIFHHMPENQVMAIRNKNRERWNELFDLERNTGDYLSIIHSLED